MARGKKSGVAKGTRPRGRPPGSKNKKTLRENIKDSDQDPIDSPENEINTENNSVNSSDDDSASDSNNSSSRSTRRSQHKKRVSQKIEKIDQNTEIVLGNRGNVESVFNSSDNTSDSNSLSSSRPKRVHKKFDKFRTMYEDNSECNDGAISAGTTSDASKMCQGLSINIVPCSSGSDISECSRTNDDNSNSVDNLVQDNCEEVEEEIECGFIVTEEDSSENIVYQIVTEEDSPTNFEDKLGDLTIQEDSTENFDDEEQQPQQLVEVDYMDHPDVVSYEVEIEESEMIPEPSPPRPVSSPHDNKMVVDSSVFEQHECMLQLDEMTRYSRCEYPYDNSSDLEDNCVSYVECESDSESNTKTESVVTKNEVIDNDAKSTINDDLKSSDIVEPKQLSCDSVSLTSTEDEEVTSISDEITSETETKSITSLENNIETNLDDTKDTESPAIRRSSRIKTISVLKRKSKGHGLVKSKHRDEKSHDSKNSLESSSRMVSKEQNEDSKESKPVKVKSRWRRSSELEMNATTGSAGAVEANREDESEKEKTEAEIQFEKDMEERLRQFTLLQENEYHCERAVCREAKKMLCDCFLTSEEVERGERGCGEDCLNRLLMIECGPNCVVGSRCTNKRFQQSQYATCRVFKTEKKGFGIQATIDMAPLLVLLV